MKRHVDEALAELSTTYSGPTLAYDVDAIAANVEQLGVAIGDVARVLFAVKSFPSAEVLERVGAAGAGFEISALAEYALLPADLSGTRVSLNSPSPSDLDALVAKGNQLDVHLDYPEQLDGLSIPEAARAVLRLSHTGLGLGDDLVGNPMRASRFGSSLDVLLAQAADSGANSIAGVHLHNGSEVNTGDFYRAALEQIVQRAEDQEIALSSVNLGGGFHPIDDPELATLLADLSSLAGSMELLIEPGNIAARKTGYLLTQAIAVRDTHVGTHHHVTLDSSYESHAKWSIPTWAPRNFAAERYPHNLIPEPEAGYEFVLFYGASCYEKDLMGVYRVPTGQAAPIVRGDIVTFDDLNGYSFAWNKGFNGVPAAQVVLLP